MVKVNDKVLKSKRRPLLLDLPLILGSRSLWRAQVLREAGYHFRVFDSDLDEKAVREDSAFDLVMALARVKSEALLTRINESAVLITADQVCVYKNKILEKPANKTEARDRLKAYQEDQELSYYSGIRIHNTETGASLADVTIIPIYFRQIPEHDIELLLDDPRTLMCASGLPIELALQLGLVKNPTFAYVHLDSLRGLPVHVMEVMMMEIL